MNILESRLLRPVKREAADRYLLVTLLSFAASVAVTRLFLAATGYPQLGGGTFHIAHVLWGGLLLFVAAVLPIIIANRWVYTVGALLAGVGVGLFIDEVGKFITQTNDYFYPAAAPIIYAFFLVTVLFYLRVRRPAFRSPRAELYRALDALGELLEHDLDADERAELEERLHHISQLADHPNFAVLAEQLLDLIKHEQLELAPDSSPLFERLRVIVETFEGRWLNRTRHRAILTGGLVGLGLLAVWNLVRLLVALLDPAALERALTELVAFGRVTSSGALGWYYGRLAIEASVGLLLLLAAVYLLLGRERRGLGLAYLSLLLSLTTVNLLVFYFDQFVTVLTATIQFLILLGVLRYRMRFHSDGARRRAGAGAATSAG